MHRSSHVQQPGETGTHTRLQIRAKAQIGAFSDSLVHYHSCLLVFCSVWLNLRPYFFVHLLSVCSFSTRVVFTTRLYRIKIRGLMRSRSRM